MARTEDTGADIAWEYRIPVVTNAFLWYDVTKTYVIAYVISVALMSVVFVLAGDPQSVIPIARIFALVFAGLTAVSIPIAFVWYANRIAVRFTLSPAGVRYETLERKDKTLNRLLIVLALLLGRPGAAGTGLLAAGREMEFTKWTDVKKVKPHPALSVITLRSEWRVIQRLYCMPAQYQEIARYVQDHVVKHGPTT